jgi:tetracycline 7-halogenase / FADH2 O2-dependent halogenase
MKKQEKYDVAIIGSGIGGSTLAAILARHGLSVVVFEAGVHPKFSVGESMILETSELMRALAEFYDVPELAYFSSENYLEYAGTSHGIKRHFGFVHHTGGQALDPKLSLQAVIPRQPYGHELHLYRQDTDYFLTSIATSYGATVLQGTPVADVKIEPDGVHITTAKGQNYNAEYIVDAGGFRSLLAEQFDLRRVDLQTHTRGMFTHMVGVPCFNEVSVSAREYGVPFRWSEGTLHHIFEGGWLWVIPFNNHPQATNPLCSVGLLLDPRMYPPRTGTSPEEEFYEFIGQFPAIAEQFKDARAVRSWTRADRLQYSSNRVVGDRFALLGHAAGFIDPLFSKGLYVAHVSVMFLADLLLKAHESGDYSAQAFEPLEEITQAYIKMHDRLTANSIKSWSNYKLWRVYSVQWLLGAYLEYLMLSISRMRARDRAEYLKLIKDNRLAGGGFKDFFRIQEQIDALFENVNPKDEADVDRTVAQALDTFSSFAWMPLPFQAILDGSNHLPKNKFRLTLFKKDEGFMGGGAYRGHFFGDLTMIELLQKGALDYLRYARLRLKSQRKRLALQLAWGPRPTKEK